MCASIPPASRRQHRFLGREAELKVLATLFQPDGPDVLSVTGVPGVGKSSLLRAFARSGAEHGVAVHILDCRTVEPTRGAFEKAVASARTTASPDDPRVLCLDHYDHFLLLDAWLRQRFLAEIAGGLRLVLAASRPLGIGWSTTGVRTRSVKLDVLPDAAAMALLETKGVEGEQAVRTLRFTKGHPLALELASAWHQDDATGELERLAQPQVVHRLTRYFLEHVEERQTRQAVEAASTVRRVTQPILDEMLAGDAPPALFETLASLPIVEVRSDGLSLHPTVHEAVASWLRAADPSRFTTYRRRAWRVLERDGRSIGATDLWRLTADVIYLIDDPIVREAFFPSGSQAYAVEPANAGDHGLILDIVETHDGADERAVMENWLRVAPRAFHVARDATGDVQGFYLLLDPGAVSADAMQRDPVTRAWRSDLPGALRGGHRRVLLLRRWLSRESGDAPCPVQGACWLDVKRAYLEGRPLLRRVYLAVSALAPYAEAATRLGFVPVCADAGLPLASAMLDFGPGSVDAWLGRLVRASLGLKDEVALDLDRRAFVLEGGTVPLTPRELAVARILLRADGAVVRRDALLAEAWDGGYAVGSNVVDVLIRGLRKKLGPRADLIQTVRGAGYRWGA